MQVSDDISAWEYRTGPLAKERTCDAMNAAHKNAERLIVSPVAATRFVLAKMRAAEAPKPKLEALHRETHGNRNKEKENKTNPENKSE